MFSALVARSACFLCLLLLFCTVDGAQVWTVKSSVSNYSEFFMVTKDGGVSGYLVRVHVLDVCSCTMQ